LKSQDLPAKPKCPLKPKPAKEEQGTVAEQEDEAAYDFELQ
jgi:hypothetical protein